jgi:hypothetical protein
MPPTIHRVEIPPAILVRGFWLYAWNIEGPSSGSYCYIGMVGDVNGIAGSPYLRAGAHLGFNEHNNSIRRRLREKGVEPEECRRLEFFSYGPLLAYSHTGANPEYQAHRVRVGKLERRLWLAAEAGGNAMLNGRPQFGADFDEVLWLEVRAAFDPHLKLG